MDTTEASSGIEAKAANGKADGTIRSITQIPGICAAHSTNAEAGTGCTVIVCPKGATGAVDVRGGAPASRETDLLRPEETVQILNAVVLSGGSAYGLAASCGVAEELERHGIGLDVGVGVVPIVSGACLFDLACGRPDVRPTAKDGAAAAASALDPQNAGKPLQRGNVGAGTGCTVGKALGPQRAMKSGLGESVQTAGQLVCGAVAAVNACGDVVDPDTGKPVAGVLTPDGRAVGSTTQAFLDLAAQPPLEAKKGDDAAEGSKHEDDATKGTEGTGRKGSSATGNEGPSSSSPLPRTNTTISCVVTNARLTKAQATKVAQMSADAYAHAIRPTHTTNDGDTIFVMATGRVDAGVDFVGILATRALELAIADAARQATGAYGFKAACDLAD
ncbi:MAG: P1 family peptidase [Atopobiaceae bacterium]